MRYRPFPARGPWLLAGLLLLAGCELAEVTTAQAEDLVVAEVYLRIDDEGADGLALLHRTGEPGMPIPGAGVRVRRPGGEWTTFTEGVDIRCRAGALPGGLAPACFLLPRHQAARILEPGARVEVEVFWTGGGLSGATTFPGEFELRVPASAPARCRLPPDARFVLEWTRAAGAWAYVPEALLTGLDQALPTIPVGTEPFTLQGLAISEADTTVIFPTGFGLFDRFTDRREVLLAIKDGLPDGVTADVVVTALDRNAANWVRGGAFNPSGLVRIPSLFGDGTGVAASVVNRTVSIVVGEPQAFIAECL
jgi:hypothetical protein